MNMTHSVLRQNRDVSGNFKFPLFETTAHFRNRPLLLDRY